jgi:L-ascorbate metabolism protein UlaG (beta-lactamase superfamily)
VVATAPIRIGPEAFGPADDTALWWLGGAGFLVNCHGTIIMIDPAISREPGSVERSVVGFRLLDSHPIEVTAVPRLDLVRYTHADVDHLAPITARELIRTGAAFAGPRPVVAKLREPGVEEGRLRIVKPGDRFRLAEIDVAATFGAVSGDPFEVASMIQDGTRRVHVLAPGERFVVRR